MLVILEWTSSPRSAEMYPILWKQEPLKATTGFYTDRRTPAMQPALCNRATSKNLGIIDVCDNYILFLLISPKSVN
jgi:hypothetical protein